MIDEILIAEFEKVGIEKMQYFRFKLYNPNTYDKMISQAKIKKSIAIEVYKHQIKRG